MQHITKYAQKIFALLDGTLSANQYKTQKPYTFYTSENSRITISAASKNGGDFIYFAIENTGPHGSETFYLNREAFMEIKRDVDSIVRNINDPSYTQLKTSQIKIKQLGEFRLFSETLVRDVISISRINKSTIFSPYLNKFIWIFYVCRNANNEINVTISARAEPSGFFVEMTSEQFNTAVNGMNCLI